MIAKRIQATTGSMMSAYSGMPMFPLAGVAVLDPLVEVASGVS
jgi:hypothetical protein